MVQTHPVVTSVEYCVSHPPLTAQHWLQRWHQGQGEGCHHGVFGEEQEGVTSHENGGVAMVSREGLEGGEAFGEEYVFKRKYYEGLGLGACFL